MFLRVYLLFFIFFSVCSSSQQNLYKYKNGIDKPSMLSTHHFGIFSGRINNNFKERVPKEYLLNFSLESGNNFHPFVEAYLPKDPNIRKQFQNTIWYERDFNISEPADYMNIVVDGVFKGFRVDFNAKIANSHEIGISLRSYLITEGQFPFSFFTNDKTIEWFHSNIAGGEDPFGRKFYGLNKVNIKYTDRNNREMELKNGDFFIAGIELNHFYYPEFINKNNRNIAVNFGSHIGINTSKFNPSLDIGFSGNIVKKWNIKDKYQIRIGLGTSILRKNFINFNDVVDLGNNNYLGSSETMFEYTEFTRKKNYHSVSVNHQFQTPYNKKEEASYYFLVGDWESIHSGWQNGFEKLYENLSAWSWIYTYGRKTWSFSIYLKEDLFLNNAPDVQTGINFKLHLNK